MNLFPARHSSNHSLALALTALSLASCGYSPLYAPLPEGNDATITRVQVGAVEIGNPVRNVGTRRPAQRISERLRQSFPNSGPNMDTIKVYIQEVATELAINPTSVVERVSLSLNATVELDDPQGHMLFKTILSSDAPYNVENTPYSTESGKVYARLTAAQNLADDISKRVILYYRQHTRRTGTTGTVSGPANVSATGAGLTPGQGESVSPPADQPVQRFSPTPTL